MSTIKDRNGADLTEAEDIKSPGWGGFTPPHRDPVTPAEPPRA